MTEIVELKATGDDAIEWRRLVDSFPSARRDIHYTPQYHQIYEQTYGQQSSLFVFQSAGNTIVQPVVRKVVPPELTGDCNERRLDLESVYGFGGPLATNPVSHQQAKDYNLAFCEYQRSVGAVSEYCQLHPLLLEHQTPLLSESCEKSLRKQCVFIDLSQSLTDLWSSIHERQRKAVAVAKRRGVKVRRLEATDEQLDQFRAMYSATMVRVNAAESWHFPDTYFRSCRDCLGEQKVSLFAAEVDGGIGGYFYLLHEYDTCYYHFAATDPAFNKFNLSSLLLFETLLWAKVQGYKNYFLGGGRSSEEDDSLLKFKSSFSQTKSPLLVYQRILNDECYHGLEVQKVRREKADGYLPKIHNYFPVYRR
mgnify:CR=1 FL=1